MYYDVQNNGIGSVLLLFLPLFPILLFNSTPCHHLPWIGCATGINTQNQNKKKIFKKLFFFLFFSFLSSIFFFCLCIHMPPSSPINRKLSSAPASSTTTINNTIPMTNNTNRTPLLYSTAIRGCEPCKRRKRVCNGQKPCMPCAEGSQECVYSVVSEHPRSVFSTNAARRLSSGSACETCRRRKTKCDGGNPCGFCASSGIDCINNNNSLERKKRTASNENEAMDRIEDRLRRIERLMTAFTPSPLSKNCTTSNYYRKMSSPLLSAQKQQRPYRHHSIQGISSSEPTSRGKMINISNTYIRVYY